MDETICPTIGWNNIPRTWSGNIKKMRGANLGRPGEKRGEKPGEKRGENLVKNVVKNIVKKL